jgi:hypothetical protein
MTDVARVAAWRDAVFHHCAVHIGAAIDRRKPVPLSRHQHQRDVLSLPALAADGGVRAPFRICLPSFGEGNEGKPSPKVESMPPAPLSPYAAQKTMGEYYVSVFKACLKSRDRGPAILQRLWATPGPFEPVLRRDLDLHEVSDRAPLANNFRRRRTDPRLSRSSKT